MTQSRTKKRPPVATAKSSSSHRKAPPLSWVVVIRLIYVLQNRLPPPLLVGKVPARRNDGGLIWVVCCLTRALFQPPAAHLLTVIRHTGQHPRLVPPVLKSNVEPNIGGADPFGAFELPQDSSTDLALHHCKC